MAEPEHNRMHNFTHHPGVASWIDEVSEHAPDDFYKSAVAHTAEVNQPPGLVDMATTRQRQQTPNGAARSTPKPSIRSVSGPATTSTSSTTSRAAPPQFNRPTVRSLAQKFNQPSSADSSPPTARARPVRPPVTSTNSSPAQPAKEAAYGSHKFTNLKPRERPQPAPSTPSKARGVNGVRSSVDTQKVPPRKKVASPAHGTTRQPFFGEVVGEHDAATPGYGIPNVDGANDESIPNSQSQPTPQPPSSTIKIVTEDLPTSPSLPPHMAALSPLSQRSDNDLASPRSVAVSSTPHSPASDTRAPRRRSPPSRIPVPTRRMSAASDSSSSTRSAKFSTRPTRTNDKASPTRIARTPVGRTGTNLKTSTIAGTPPQQTLAASSYRGYRERGKSPNAAAPSGGPSVAAVITAPPQPPTSPRLRNSRERQMLQETSDTRSKSADAHGAQESSHAVPQVRETARMLEPAQAEKRLSVRRVDPSDEEDALMPGAQKELDRNDTNLGIGLDLSGALQLSTAGLAPPARPVSSATSFEESPVLGMPGSFMMTPPMVQHSPELTKTFEKEDQKSPLPSNSEQGAELLQARSFQPVGKSRVQELNRTETPQEEVSELGVRESIPIMLGSEAPSPGWTTSPKRPGHQTRLSIGSQTWRVEPLDSTGTISYLNEDDSPTGPFANRETLRPEDSASVAFYQQIERQPPSWINKTPDEPEKDSFTLDSEAYSVINKILNVYHESDTITPKIAQDSWKQVMSVSPIVAQHRDWSSKEATETYLARLLSDAAPATGRDGASASKAAPTQAHYTTPGPTIRQLAADQDEASPGGTAIIFPSQLRRYSRGSAASTTTTIHDGPSRPDSFSDPSARDRALANGMASPPVPSKEWTSPLVRDLQLQLPEIPSTGEGLGLSLQLSNLDQQSPHTPSHTIPPLPDHSPPPPPSMGLVASRICSDTSGGDDLGHENQPLLDGDAGLTYEQLRRQQELNYGTARIHAGARPSIEAVEKLPDSMSTIVPVDEPAKSPDVEESAEAVRAKAVIQVQKRYRVIEELCKTEHSFCVDMMVAHQIFEATSKEVLTDAERRLLFSNCKDLENFSHNLWKSLKDGIRPIVNQLPPDENSEEPYNEFLQCTPENDREVKVGEIMLAFAPRMERVYTTYYLNYGDASDFIKKNTQNSELLGWVMACFQHCPNLTTAWDLDSLLIKPVQRMLRYPILLSELIEKTVPDHPDLALIRQAKDTITKIAERIDVAKKRQETLRAATSEGKKQKSKGGGERNVKSIVKALRWSKEKAKTLQEAALIFEDQDYNQVTQKFGGHFFQIQIVISDMDQYLEALTTSTVQLNSVMMGYITVSETGPSANAEMESTWRRWAMAHLDLQNKALEDHKAAVRDRVMKPISDLWDQWVGPQKLMEQRKKLLIQYAKFVQTVERKEKVEPKLDEAANSFLTINDSLKHELPKLYELTKTCIRVCSIIFIGLSKDWYKTCSKKILPLLETEPQHTTSISYDFKMYQERFKSDFRQMEERAKSLAIINHDLINSLSNYMSPITISDDASSRKSSSRRTESIGSEMSLVDRHNNRNSGGYNSTRSGMRSFEGPPRNSSSTNAASGPPISYYNTTNGTTSAASSMFRDRSSAPSSETTVTSRPTASRTTTNMSGNYDGTYEDTFAVPASMGASFLQPTFPTLTSPSQPPSTRTSGVFVSALPMSSQSAGTSAEELSTTPSDTEEPEVLFLAASLFEFNIAHDRREGGIPYLVYVPGEIFDVIGMKGELWLARNQDDASRTVGWIWEKHFARILPEEG